MTRGKKRYMHAHAHVHLSIDRENSFRFRIWMIYNRWGLEGRRWRKVRLFFFSLFFSFFLFFSVGQLPRRKRKTSSTCVVGLSFEIRWYGWSHARKPAKDLVPRWAKRSLSGRKNTTGQWLTANSKFDRFPELFFLFFSLNSRSRARVCSQKRAKQKRKKASQAWNVFKCMSSSTKRLHIYGSVVQSGNLAAPTTAIYIRTCVYVCVSLRVVFQHRNSCTRGGGTGGRASFDPTKTRSFLSSRVRKKYECSNKIFEKYVRSVRRQNVQDCALHSTNQVFLLGNCNWKKEG